MENTTTYSPVQDESITSTFFKHPAFWPGFSHKEGDYGFYFNFVGKKGQEIPFETTQLNVTKGYTFDYTNVHTEDPPKFLPYSFEIYDWKAWGVYGTKNWHFPLVMGVAYLAVIFGLEKYMRNRPAFKLKWPLFLWNVSLGIFSIIGFIRTAPEFFSILADADKGFYKGICFR